MEYGVIMAGGAGTRLWPLSRSDQPKQLLNVVRGKSLLQLSYERLRGLLPPERIFICTAAAHADKIFENLPELPRENLLGEPLGRDTANAVGFPAAVLQKRDKDAIAAFVTADHVIEPVEEFRKSLRFAFDVVVERPNALVTFGIIPTHGHTGLGYIHRGEPLRLKKSGNAYRVQAFKEKPDKPTADRYAESGRYYWEQRDVRVAMLDGFARELALHLPEAHRGLSKITESWGGLQQQQTLNEIYPMLPKISIDYAVMEPASHGKGEAEVVVVEMPVQWLDIGAWPALAETMSSDEHDNATDCQDCVFVDSDGNIIFSRDPNHLVATVGVSDMIIVHTKDVTMVCPKSDAQRVKDLVGRVKDRYGQKYDWNTE